MDKSILLLISRGAAAADEYAEVILPMVFDLTLGWVRDDDGLTFEDRLRAKKDELQSGIRREFLLNVVAERASIFFTSLGTICLRMMARQGRTEITLRYPPDETSSTAIQSAEFGTDWPNEVAREVFCWTLSIARWRPFLLTGTRIIEWKPGEIRVRRADGEEELRQIRIAAADPTLRWQVGQDLFRG